MASPDNDMLIAALVAVGCWPSCWRCSYRRARGAARQEIGERLAAVATTGDLGERLSRTRRTAARANSRRTRID
jgi:alkylhydroperoxidase/carboxymuconolactone decarboxylase family protein YurZ